MERERTNHLSELAKLLPYLSLIAVSLLAFNREQRAYIHTRDEEFGIKKNKGGCQAPFDHPCNGDTKGTQIHHLKPQRFLKAYGVDPDFVENGITLCEYSHQHVIHKDMELARKNYGRDKDSYKKVFAEREAKLKRHEVYWNTVYDRAMECIALRSQQRARKAGLVPPEGKNERTRSSTSHD